MTYLFTALGGGLLFCVVASVISPWVVLRRLSYATDALAHATFGGIALGLFLGMGDVSDPSGVWKLLATSLAFSVVISQLLALLMRLPFLSQDAATGIVYAGAFAMGGIFLSLKRDASYGHTNLESLLFGNILLLNIFEIRILAILAVLSVLGAWFQRRALQLWAFDSDLALAEGVRTGLLHYSLIGAVALVTVVTTKFLGLMMVMAFLVIPGSVGLMIGRSMRSIYLISWLFSSVCLVTGLLLIATRFPDVPAGSLTTAVGFIFFILLVMLRLAFGRRRKMPEEPAP